MRGFAGRKKICDRIYNARLFPSVRFLGPVGSIKHVINSWYLQVTVEKIVKIAGLTALLIGFFLGLNGQQTPIYSQFFLNPYVYNPAYAGNAGRSVAFLSYRKQWIGIEGAPETATFTFHTPMKRSLALGGQIYYDRRSLLKSTSALVSLTYRALFTEQQGMSFAITGGASMNNIELDNINDPAILSDPALFDLVDSNVTPTASFGFNYFNGGFNLGISLPSLFKREVVGVEQFTTVELDPVKNYILMANYRLNLGDGSFALEPHLLYRVTETLPDQWEALAVLHMKNILWVGGSYRQDYGPTALLGLNVKDFMSVGYAYEFANTLVDGIPDGTHEIQIKLNLGKSKNFKKPEKEEESGNRDARFYSGGEPQFFYEAAPVDRIGTADQPLDDPGLQENFQEEMTSGHYVILKGFNSFESAYQYWAGVINDYGYKAGFGYSTRDDQYYVYLYHSEDYQETEIELEKAKLLELFEDAYSLEID